MRHAMTIARDIVMMCDALGATVALQNTDDATRKSVADLYMQARETVEHICTSAYCKVSCCSLCDRCDVDSEEALPDWIDDV